MNNLKHHSKNFIVFFAGGQSAGPVTPLIAVAERWSKIDPHFTPIFFDVRKSVAAKLAPSKGFTFHNLFAAKFRRYLSVWTLFVPFVFFLSLLQSFAYVYYYRPSLIIGAGGFVQIPLIIAGRLFGVRSVIHQQDITTTLSNFVCGPFARKITAVFERSLRMFPQGNGFSKNYSDTDKVVWIGNPIMNDKLPSHLEGIDTFKLKHDWPTVLITGGGTGAEGLNRAVLKALPDLLKTAQVIHTTGRGKKVKFAHERYHQFEFLDNMSPAFAAADIVVSRAGIGTIAELSEFSKCTILVPMPSTHQVANAQWLSNKQSAVLLPQQDVAENLPLIVRDLIHNHATHEQLSHNIHKIMPRGATDSFIDVCKKVLAHQK